MEEKHFWLLIILTILIFSLKAQAKNRLELSYQSINRDLPYYQMTATAVYFKKISHMGTGIFDYSELTKQTLKYSHFTQLWARPVEIELSLGKEQAEGSWDLREPGGYWYGESESLDSISVRGTFTYFLSQGLGLKVGFAREDLDHKGFAGDNNPPWLRTDWTRKDQKNSLILGIEKSLLENFKLECNYASIEESQNFSNYGEATTGRWAEDTGEGKFRGDGWIFEVTYLKDSLRLKLLSSFENSEGDFEDVKLTSEGWTYIEPLHTYSKSLKKFQYCLALGFSLTKRLSVDLGYFIDKRDHIYNYLDNTSLDYDFYKNGFGCGLQLLILPSLKFRIDYSHADFKRKDDWYYLSKKTPNWEGKGEEDKINLGWIFEF
ncbi:hypothetical protein ES703_122273 [subsurface metagenome]